MSQSRHKYLVVIGSVLCIAFLAALIFKYYDDQRQSALAWNESYLKLNAEPFGKLAFEFPFRNPSAHTFYVERWTTSCGCTVASMSSTIIRSGQSGVLSGLFDPGEQTGLQRKTIILEYYDEAHHAHIDTLTVDIQIKDVVAIAPSSLNFPIESESQTGSVVVTPLVNNIAGMLFESTHSLVDGTVVPPVNGANTYKVNVNVDKGFSGTNQGLLIVKLLNGDKKVYNLLIAAGKN